MHIDRRRVVIPSYKPQRICSFCEATTAAAAARAPAKKMLGLLAGALPTSVDVAFHYASLTSDRRSLTSRTFPRAGRRH